MSYQDTLDRKATIKVARRELNHFSDLLKLHETSSYNVGRFVEVLHDVLH